MDILKVLRHKKLNEASSTAKSNAGKLLNSFKEYQKSPTYNDLQVSNPTLKRDMDNAFSKLNASLTNEFKKPDQVSDEEIDKEIKDLESLLNQASKSTNTNNIDSQLKGIQQKLQQQISLKNRTNINNELKPYLNQVTKKVDDSLNDIADALKPSFKGNKEELLKDVTKHNDYAELFSSLNSKLGAYNAFSWIKMAGNNDKLKQLIEDSISNIKAALRIEDTDSLKKLVAEADKWQSYIKSNAKNPVLKNNSTEDYKAELLKVAGTEKADDVLNRYYKQEFSNIPIQKLQAIQGPFEQDLLKWGFNEASNPFISFIKQYLGIQGQDLTENQYKSIHNAAAEGSLDGSDLRGKGVLGKFNIIFSPTLYKKNWEEIAGLLKIQKDYSEEYNLSKLTNAQVREYYNNFTENTDRESFLVSLLYEGSDMTKREFKGSTFDKGVRSLADVESILQWCGGGKIEKQEKPKKQSWQTAMKIKDFHAVPTKDNIPQLMSALINRYSDPRTMVNLNQKYNLPNEISINTIAPWIQDLEKIEINKNNYQDILAELDKMRQEK